MDSLEVAGWPPRGWVAAIRFPEVATTRYLELSMRANRSRTLFLVVLALLPLVLASCVSGRTQLARGWSGTAIHDGVVYVGTADGRVVAITIDGSQKWPDPVVVDDPPVAIYTTPAVHGNLVCIGSYASRGGKASGRVYGLSTNSGVVSWEYPRRPQYMGAIVGSPVMDNGTIYFSSSDSTVYALNTTDGRLNWKTEILDGRDRRLEKLWTSLVVQDGRVYVSTFDGRIQVLSAQTGALLNMAFKSETGFTPTPAVHDDVIYVGSFDNSLYAIRIDEAELLWRFAGGKWFWAAPLVSEGVVYAGCLDGRLYAIDAETGEELRRFEARDARGGRVPIVSPPVLMDDLLIVVDEFGAVYVLDADGGSEDQWVPRRVVSLDTGVKSSFCVHEGVAYVRGEDDRLYAVDIDSGMVTWSLPVTVAGGG